MIIGVAFILVVAILAMEFVIFKKRFEYKAIYLKIQQLIAKLEILKDLSYIPSKESSLDQDLEILSKCFFKQAKFTKVTLIKISSQDSQVYRFSKNNSLFKETTNNLSDFENKIVQLGPSQVGTIKKVDISNFMQEDLQSVIIQKIIDQGKNFQIAMFFSNEQLSLDKDEENFLKTVGFVISLLFKSSEYNKVLTKEDQFKAVNIKW